MVVLCYWGMQLQIARRLMQAISWDVNWIVNAIKRDVFYSTDNVVGSKMARKMLCFTMEMAALDAKVGSARRWLQAMSALCSRRGRLVQHYNGGSDHTQWKAVCGILLRNATVECQAPYKGGCEVVMGCDYWCGVFGECNCRLLDALKRWLQGGVVLLGNAIADC